MGLASLKEQRLSLRFTFSSRSSNDVFPIVELKGPDSTVNVTNYYPLLWCLGRTDLPLGTLFHS